MANDRATASSSAAGSSSPSAQRRGSVGGSSSERRLQKAPIRLVHAFGSHCTDSGAALLIDENTVLHRTGRWLVSQPVSQTGQAVPKLTFVFELEAKVKKLTAVCISDNRKYIALCEQCEPADASSPPPPPQLRVVNVQARRTICVLSGALEGSFVGCTFSSDSKHVLAYTGAPDHVSVVWQFAEERPVGMHKSRSALSRVLFNPWMGSLISLSAPLRLARLNDQGHFKEIEVTSLKRYGGECIDHAWLAAKVLVFIDGDGSIHVVEESVLRQSMSLEASPTQAGEASKPTSLTVLTNKGFAVGCADGAVHVYMRNGVELGGGSGEFVRVCALRGPSGGGPVRSMQVSANDASALLLCDELCFMRLREQIARAKEGISSAGLDALESGGGALSLPSAGLSSSSAGSADGRNYDVLLHSGHTGRVIGMSCAVSKALMVSCAADLTLRVWDLRRLSCQLVQPLPTAPLSISLHPDGLHLCLAFDNRLSLSHIGLDALLPWRELPLPSVRQALYSNGGHLLLAAQAKSVVVFESYSLNRIAVCSAHLAPITALAWSADDTAFTSGGNDGMFYTWSAEQIGKRVGECRLYKGAGVSDLAVLSEARKPIDDDMAQAQLQASRRGGGKGGEAEPEHTVIVSELPLGGDSLCRVVTLPKAKLAFVGTLGGAVHSVACGGAVPGAFEKLMPKGAPVRPHLGAVSALLPSRDEVLLFSAGDDGSIFVFELPGALPPGGHALEAMRLSAGAAACTESSSPTAAGRGGIEDAVTDAAGVQYSEVQCVSRESLERSAQELADARSQHSQLTESLAAERDRLEARTRGTIAQKEREFADAQLEAEIRQRQSAAAQNAEIASLHKRFGAFAQKAEESARARQLHLEQCLRKEMTTHEEVSAELSAVREHASAELARLSLAIEEAAEAKRRLEQAAEERLGDVKASFEKDLEELEVTVEARQLQLIDEYDETLLHERTAAAAKQEEQTTEIKSLTMQQFLTRKKLEQHAKDKEAREVELRRKDEKAEEAANEITELRATIEKLKQQASAREKELQTRDGKAAQMHTATQRLESQRQLLELRVKELEEVHEPMMVQLYDLKMTAQRLEAELLAEGEKRAKAETEAAELAETRTKLQNALKKAERKAADAEMSHLTTINRVYSLIDQQAGAAALMELVRTRDAELKRAQERNGRPRQERPPPDDEDLAMLREATRQRDKMQEKAAQLEGELRRTKAKAHENRMSLALEAQRMFDELNSQRKRNGELTRDLEQATKQVAMYAKALSGGGGRAGRSGSQLRILTMPPAAGGVAGGAAGGAGGAGGMTHSATVGDLRTSAALNADDPTRPETAPGERIGGDHSASASAPLASTFSAPGSTLASARDAAHMELSDAMERHMLENARLRENLLHFTSKQTKKGKRGGANPSLGMPLPPV